MRRATRLTALFIVVLMVLSLHINVLAQEQVLPSVPAAEQPSSWATEGVQWTGIYKLANQDMFTKYTSKVTREELYAVCVNMYERMSGKAITPIEKSPFSDATSTAVLKACAANILSGSGKFEPQKEATRLDMVTGVYNAIKAAQPNFNYKVNMNLAFKDASKIPQGSMDVVKYAVSKGILNGRSNDALDLDSSCTRQELMVFVKSAYEFAIYEAGKDAKGAFWKVSDEDSTVYLLGSVHVADPSMYPLSKDILSAYEESDALAVEADIANQQEGILYMQQKMMYADDNTLDKNVPKEVYDRFVEAIKPSGIPAETYNKFKPWAAAMIVQQLNFAEASYDATLGIDLFFLTKATGKKNILEIEGIKFQVDMFDSFSKELQENFLEGSLETDDGAQEEANKVFDELIGYWKTGNMVELEKLVKSDENDVEELKEFNEKMWESRDTNMAKQVEKYLADPEKKTYFVVVGAGHMVGKTGIVAQLKDEYKIEQVK